VTKSWFRISGENHHTGQGILWWFRKRFAVIHIFFTFGTVMALLGASRPLHYCISICNCSSSCCNRRASSVGFMNKTKQVKLRWQGNKQTNKQRDRPKQWFPDISSKKQSKIHTCAQHQHYFRSVTEKKKKKKGKGGETRGEKEGDRLESWNLIRLLLDQR